MPKYGEKKYWEKRYETQKGETFDWLEDYNSLKPIIKNLGLKNDAFILNIGCGNSEFSEKMYNDGFKNNYNIDICENVINYMKERNKDKKGLNYQVMDVRDMKGFKDETFDFIIDKSTLDALLCGENSFVDVVYMTKEISRILKVGGIYFIISYGKPENRLLHLQRKHLAFNIQVIELKQKTGNENSLHFIYVCKKLPEANKNINKIDIVLKEMGVNMNNNNNEKIKKDNVKNSINDNTKIKKDKITKRSTSIKAKGNKKK